jgi:hypothetical protein
MVSLAKNRARHGEGSPHVPKEYRPAANRFRTTGFSDGKGCSRAPDRSGAGPPGPGEGPQTLKGLAARNSASRLLTPIF